jgi:hypothetical protein
MYVLMQLCRPTLSLRGLVLLFLYDRDLVLLTDLMSFWLASVLSSSLRLRWLLRLNTPSPGQERPMGNHQRPPSASLAMLRS